MSSKRINKESLLILRFVLLAMVVGIANADPLQHKPKIINGVEVFTASVEKCHFAKDSIPRGGVHFIRDSVSNEVYYMNTKSGNVIRYEKIDSLDAARLFQRIDSIDFQKFDFNARVDSVRLSRAKREGQMKSRTDGCLERITIKGKTDTLKIDAWNLFWKIEQSQKDDDQIRRVYNLQREAYAIIGKVETLMPSK